MAVFPSCSHDPARRSFPSAKLLSLFYERECQEKIFLHRAEVRRGLVSAFSPLSRVVPVRDDDMPWDLFRSPQADHAHFSPWSSNIVADHREAVGGCWFRLSAFPLDGNVFGRTARSGQGRAARRGEANPLPRGPFCDHGGRGKAESRFRTILKRRASQTDARVATIVLSEARGL
jgi:hypothetical protein